MKRAFDMGFNIHQIGVREFSTEEKEFRFHNRNRITCQPINYPYLARNGRIGDKVYLTIDIDALDMSIMPATGTPAPGGLSWEVLQDLISSIAHNRTIVGFDLMEFSPIPNFHCYDFLAAKIVYETIIKISKYNFHSKSIEQKESTGLRIYE